MLDKIRSATKGPIALGTIRTSLLFGGRLIIQASSLLLVAKMLGAEEFGSFAGISSLALLFGTLSAFGTNFVLLDLVSKDPARRYEVLSYAIPVILLLGSVLQAFYLVVCVFLLHSLNSVVSILILIGLAEILLQPLLSLMVAEHHALGRIARSQTLNMLPLALRLASIVVVALCQVDQKLYWYAWGYLGASVVSLWMGFLTLPSTWPALSKWRLARVVELRYAAGFAVMNVTAVGPSELDKALAAKLLPLGEAGIYAVAVRVIGAIILPVTAMGLSAQPRLFREGGKVTVSERSRKLLRRMFFASLSYSSLLAVTLWLTAPILGFIFGGDFGGVVEALRWLCWVAPAMALRLTAGNILVALGSPLSRSSFEFSGMLAIMVLALLFVPCLGIDGMVIALLLAEWAMAIVGVISVIRCVTR